MTTIYSSKTVGTVGVPVAVECSISKGIGIHLVGLPDEAVKESLLRTVTALQANNIYIPGKKIVVNLAPADLVKSGSGYDLPIALSLIAESGQEDGRLHDLDEWLVVGELGLDGSVREVAGCVQAVETAIDQGCKGVIIPKADGPEVAQLFANTIPVYAVGTMREAIDILSGINAQTAWDEYLNEPAIPSDGSVPVWDSILRGRLNVKRALEIAAAGGHNLLMVGVPGSGKASAAKGLLEILPPMGINEAIDVAAIYSAAGKGLSRVGDRGQRRRPFRAPHASSSLAALLGGGCGGDVLPGEVALAHNGILFLDEFAEWPKRTMDALRGPIEDKKVTISRLKSMVEYPTDFLLVGATNPCPCGYYGEGDRCTCTPAQREAYLAHLSGPVYDLIDLQLWLHPGVPVQAAIDADDETLEVAADKVSTARAVQAVRYKDTPYRTNNDVPAKDAEKLFALDGEALKMAETLVERLGLSARAWTRILRIARTIADLDGAVEVKPQHVAEAASYRFLDRGLSE